MDFEAYLKEKAKIVDGHLERMLPQETAYPEVIHRAMRYSIFAGGKRLRPILSLTAYETFGGRGEEILPAACALEMMHTFSLIHDDLPCMDDDDFRRGKPTCHKVFGEAMAVLAGDALCIFAFEILGRYRPLPIVEEVGRALGTGGMLGGQVVDISSEGLPDIDESTLEYIHKHKTESLITTSLRVGALIAGAKEEELKLLTCYGNCVGLAFQIVDDILDVVGTTEGLGKDAGSDAERRKATYPSVFGIERSREKARVLSERAKETLKPLGERGDVLRRLSDFIVERIH